MMRIYFCAIAAVLAANLAWAEEAPAPTPAPPPEGTGAPKTIMPSPQVMALLQKVQTLNAQQHYFDALKELDQAETLAPGNALIPNVRGSIYTSMRDFDKARECFEEALKRMPGAFEPQFNLAELMYVQGKYAEAEAAFNKLLKDVPRLREEVRHLTQFKVVVCRLKQKQVAEAEEAGKSFTFMDDTPAYYFTKAAIAYQKEDKTEAESWLSRAQRIFKPQQNSPYLDSLMEAHWVESINVPRSEAGTEKPAGSSAIEVK